MMNDSIMSNFNSVPYPFFFFNFPPLQILIWKLFAVIFYERDDLEVFERFIFTYYQNKMRMKTFKDLK